MTLYKRSTLFISLFIILVFCLQQYIVKGVPESQVSIEVLNTEGKPVRNAIIIFYNWLNPAEKPVVCRTDDKGIFQGSIKKGAYYVYILHFNNKGKIDYVPEKIDLHTYYRGFDSVNIKAVLYPSAELYIKGNIIFIGGIWQESFLIEVYDVNNVPISKKLIGGKYVVNAEGVRKGADISLIDVYGVTADRIFIEKALGVRISGRSAYVPANIPLRIKVSYRVYDKRTNAIETYSIFKGDIENPLILKPGEISEVIDLTKVGLESALSILKQDVNYASNLLQEYEGLGFYLPDEIESLRKAQRLVEEARSLYNQNGSYNVIIANLEKAYVITRDNIPRRLSFIRTVSMEGAVILPVFLAVFAAVLAYYIFESDKKKVYSFLVFYSILLGLFILIYPGFSILWRLDRNLFIISISSSFVFFATFLFVIPKVIKEPELPGEIDIPGLISISFSLAKRYSKVRKLRTFITVFSIAALIWAFTVLASFSQVYAKVYESNVATCQNDLLLVRRIVNGSQYPLSYELDTDVLKSFNVSEIAYRVYSDPGISLTVRLEYKGKEYIVHSIAGFSRYEKDFTSLDSFFVGDKNKFGEAGYIVVPKTAYLQLGLKEGEKLVVSFEGTGFEAYKVVFTVAGYFDEDRFDNVKDLDGYLLKPFIPASNNKMIYVNSSDVVFFNWKQLLFEIFSGESGRGGILHVYSIIARPSSKKAAIAIANELIDRRGGEYVILYCFGGTCDRVRYGAKMESVFQKDITFIVPLAIVTINVLITMYDIVRERKKEIFIFTTVGFNPLHIALVFMAEAIIYGLLSGGFGYVSGLATFRVLGKVAYAQNLLIREKLEWYWSFIAIIVAIFVAILGAFRPAMEAAFMYAPTEKRKIRVEQKEAIKREDKYLITTAKKTFGIPGSVSEGDAEIFYAFLNNKLEEYSIGEIERIENIKEFEEEVRPDGTKIKRITFNYITKTAETEVATIECELRIIKDSGSDKYRVELVAEPKGKTSIRYMDYVADLVRDIMKSWERERERLF